MINTQLYLIKGLKKKLEESRFMKHMLINVCNKKQKESMLEMTTLQKEMIKTHIPKTVAE